MTIKIVPTDKNDMKILRIKIKFKFKNVVVSVILSVYFINFIEILHFYKDI